jgi:exopolysaccharide production protein ExoQ
MKPLSRNWNRGSRMGNSTAWIPDDRFAWAPPLIGFMMVILLTVPKDFISLVAEPPSPSASDVGTYFNSLLWLVVFALGGFMLLWRARLAMLLVRELNIAFLLFCALILASTLWSADPGVTLERFRRVITISGCCLAAMLVGWHRGRFQELVRPGVTLLLVASILEGMVFPKIGIHDPSIAELKNSWRGVTGQKNILGGLATYGVILWYHAWLQRDAATWKILSGMAVSLTCLILSRSSTSLLTTVFSLFFLTLALRSPANLRRYTPYFVGLFSVLVALYACAALGVIPGLQMLLDPITALTGKDAHTATGRAPIWALIKAEIARHPYLGIGYGAYWTGPIPGTASYIFVTAIYFYAYSAHNGYLEVTNDLGYVGLACLIAYVLVYVKQSLRLWKIDRYQSALFLALLFQQGLENLSEAEWLQVTTVNFLVMTLATCALARALLDHKLQHLFARTAGTAAGAPIVARARA